MPINCDDVSNWKSQVNTKHQDYVLDPMQMMEGEGVSGQVDVKNSRKLGKMVCSCLKRRLQGNGYLSR